MPVDGLISWVHGSMVTKRWWDFRQKLQFAVLGLVEVIKSPKTCHFRWRGHTERALFCPTFNVSLCARFDGDQMVVGFRQNLEFDISGFVIFSYRKITWKWKPSHPKMTAWFHDILFFTRNSMFSRSPNFLNFSLSRPIATPPRFFERIFVFLNCPRNRDSPVLQDCNIKVEATVNLKGQSRG